MELVSSDVIEEGYERIMHLGFEGIVEKLALSDNEHVRAKVATFSSLRRIVESIRAEDDIRRAQELLNQFPQQEIARLNIGADEILRSYHAE
jgi:hypothetical protein